MALRARPSRIALLLLAISAALPAVAQTEAPPFRDFSSRGLPRSQGVTVRLSHPSEWRPVEVDDELVLAELRGPQGKLEGVLQVGRGLRRHDMAALCKPERAQTLMQGVPDVRVTDVVARLHQGRQAYEVRYEKSQPPVFLRVRSLIVCLKDSQLLVSCAGNGEDRAALPAIDPVCERVMDSLAISEE